MGRDQVGLVVDGADARRDARRQELGDDRLAFLVGRWLGRLGLRRHRQRAHPGPNQGTELLELGRPVVVEIVIAIRDRVNNAPGHGWRIGVDREHAVLGRDALAWVLARVPHEGVLDDLAERLVVQRVDDMRWPARIAKVAKYASWSPNTSWSTQASTKVARPRSAAHGGSSIDAAWRRAAASCVVRDRLLGDGSQRPESGQTGGIGIRLGPRDNGRPQSPLELVARGERRVNLVELAQDAARPRLGLERIVDLEEFVSAADDGVGDVVDGRCPPGTSSMGDGPVAPVATTLLVPITEILARPRDPRRTALQCGHASAT